jgi:hypothetical protein
MEFRAGMAPLRHRRRGRGPGLVSFFPPP